jgi:hypothetical protein
MNCEVKLGQVFLLPKPVVIMEFTYWFFAFSSFATLTLILLTWTIWRAPTNASKWRMGFNSAFKGLKIVTWSLISKLFNLSMKCINGRLVTGALYITRGKCAALSSQAKQNHTHSDRPHHTVSRQTRFCSDQSIVCMNPMSGKW